MNKIAKERETMISQAEEMLIKGVDGEIVVERMRCHYSTQSLATNVSILKSRILDLGKRHSEYDDSDLRAYESIEPSVKEFLSAPLREQYQIQKRHRKMKTWPDEAEECLSRLKLVPENLLTFKVKEGEVQKIKLEKCTKRRARMANKVNIPNAGDVLAKATETLEKATVKDSLPSLCCSLALVSGRRMTELLNCRSKFTAAGKRCVLFEGQLKKPKGMAFPYKIPLLVDTEIFLFAYAVLREKTGDVSHLTNYEIHKRYFGSLSSSRIRSFMPTVPNFHLLRSMYAKFTYHFFDHNCSYNLLAMRILGHCEEEESLSYTHVKLLGLASLYDSFGELPISVL